MTNDAPVIADEIHAFIEARLTESWRRAESPGCLWPFSRRNPHDAMVVELYADADARDGTVTGDLRARWMIDADGLRRLALDDAFPETSLERVRGMWYETVLSKVAVTADRRTVVWIEANGPRAASSVAITLVRKEGGLREASSRLCWIS